jgi:N-acetyl sugar amidotransferase
MIKNPNYFDTLRHCTKCMLPETHESFTFDEDGVCSVCRNHEYKNEVIDWKAREKEFVQLIEQFRGKADYDCIIPGSGGKDSTYQVYVLVTKYKLKPLVVTFDHNLMRPQVRSNWERALRKLGVDHINFRPNWNIVKKTMVEALKRKGDFCWHCHSGIYAYPMQIAVKFRIPLIIWGEPTSEYTSYVSYDGGDQGREVLDEKAFNRYINLGITADDMYEMLGEEVTLRDLSPYQYPKYKDLKALGYRSVCLGDYLMWDIPKQVETIKRELGWKEDLAEGVPPEYAYEKIECMMQGVRDYIKFVKRGYGRTNHLMSLAIRNGKKTRTEAIELVNQYDGKRPASLDLFLKWTELSEEEFMEIVEQHCIAPHKHDHGRIRNGLPLWDQGQWDYMVGEE